MALIGYARVSTQEQNEGRQVEVFKELGVEKWFIDKQSGKNTARPQLKAMREYVREGDTVIVTEYARLARTVRDLLAIIDKLTTMLKSSQEQQATLVTALSAAQALHAGTIQERLTEHSGSSERQAETKAADSVPDEIRKSAQELQQKRKGFFARIIRQK